MPSQMLEVHNTASSAHAQSGHDDSMKMPLNSTPRNRVEYRTLTPGLARAHDIICIDTEFSRLPNPKEAVWDWASNVELLSIGAVAVDRSQEPKSFYGVRTLTDTLRSLCGAFVTAEVLPRLQSTPSDFESAAPGEIAEQLARFLSGRATRIGKPLLLATDWIGDAYLIELLAGHVFNWLLLDGVAEIQAALGADFPPGWERHNALHDATAVSNAVSRL